MQKSLSIFKSCLKTYQKTTQIIPKQAYFFNSITKGNVQQSKQINQIFKNNFLKNNFQFCSLKDNNNKNNDNDTEQHQMQYVPKHGERKTHTLSNGSILEAEISEEKGSVSYTISGNIKGPKGSNGEGLYVLMYTCKICNTKQMRSFTKQAYHEGVVLLRCEGCDKLHLIADNLGFFDDKKTNVFDYVDEKEKRHISLEQQQEINQIVNSYLQDLNKKQDSEQTELNQESQENQKDKQ
ncbi:hypothetical protein PPERSA_01139 [Pseudocohnilembus persalinus]|uniref:DNL-type domain-containing protein n=1 Tax=Pseudocohnilembus persalinus TaxID=266149 RepID=A0A0V0QVF2_PSEPJ|nr:hypothetical protein PPERSA_01139 [Pseudocohnilembus persalinus]|eukprot:KRX06061.1 hypothetical protein PPERSA_01139 [Pseudocohnilembus persalinus]